MTRSRVAWLVVSAEERRPGPGVGAPRQSAGLARPTFGGATLGEAPPLTVRAAHAARCRVAALCLECDQLRELDLRGFAANRLAGTPLAELPLRCRCGSRAFRVTVSGREAR